MKKCNKLYILNNAKVGFFNIDKAKPIFERHSFGHTNQIKLYKRIIIYR